MFNDRTGQRFGSLIAQEYLPSRKWRCLCDCGNSCEVFSTSFVQGRTKSCGCLEGDHQKRSHRKSATAEYRAWSHMKGRCYDVNDKMYAAYGARGIKVCDRWRNSFENFYADMGLRPDGYSIDRIDVNGDYCAENCEWIPLSRQNMNKRNSVKYLYEGEMLTLKEIVARTGLPKTTVFRWLKAGVPLTKPTWQRFSKAA